MEVFKFKTSDKGKLFDVKLLGVEPQLTREYEVITRPEFKNHQRILFHALINGQIEIVDLSKKRFMEMFNLYLEFAQRIGGKLTDKCFIRFNIDTFEIANTEYLDFNMCLIKSDLYNPESQEVKEQIQEFDLTLEKAMDLVKDEFSKESHWSNKIKVH